MTLTKEEIVDLALRYLSSDEVTDFPMDNDLFCLLMRELPTDRILKEDEGWNFGGYGICKGYTFDEEAKPRGKWLWMHFASLSSFPPVVQVLKLQPPHAVKGQFQSADRSHEIRILKVVLTGTAAVEKKLPGRKKSQGNLKETQESDNSTKPDNIIAFRPKDAT